MIQKMNKKTSQKPEINLSIVDQNQMIKNKTKNRKKPNQEANLKHHNLLNLIKNLKPIKPDQPGKQQIFKRINPSRKYKYILQ